MYNRKKPAPPCQILIPAPWQRKRRQKAQQRAQVAHTHVDMNPESRTKGFVRADDVTRFVEGSLQESTEMWQNRDVKDTIQAGPSVHKVWDTDTRSTREMPSLAEMARMMRESYVEANPAEMEVPSGRLPRPPHKPGDTLDEPGFLLVPSEEE